MESLVYLLNCLGIGIVCTDQEGKVQFWNRSMEEWTGVVSDVIHGHSLGSCFPQLKGISERDTLKHPYNAPVSFQPPPAQTNRHHASVQVTVTEFKVSARDVGARASGSGASNGHLNHGLRGQVDIPTISGLLDGSSEWHRIWTFQPRQQQLEQAHADFVATVSHELRTPLTSIKGFVDTLLQCHGQLSAEQEQRFLRIVKHEADRLIHMVEDVLLVSHLQSGHLHNCAQQLALPDAFERVLSGFSPEQQERVQLNYLPGLPTVWADPDRLDQILTNLLDNAMRFSEPSTPVEVEAGLDRKDPNRVSILIRDHGCGMGEDKLALLFRRFGQIDNPMTRNEHAGTGLGLYITKSLVESFGGHIEIESELDVGTTCCITLPSAPDIRWTPPDPQPSNSEPVPEWANSLL